MKKGLGFIIAICSIWIPVFIFVDNYVIVMIVLIASMVAYYQYGELLQSYITNFGNDKDEIIKELKDDMNILEDIITQRNNEIRQIWIQDSRKDNMIRTLHLMFDQNIKHENGEDNSVCGFKTKLDAYEYFKIFTDMYVGNEEKFNS